MATVNDISVLWAGTPGESTPSCDDPVFVLCAGRSGSTLLRLLLDSHPVLACPPETKLPGLCGGLASAWASAEDVSLGDDPGRPDAEAGGSAGKGPDGGRAMLHAPASVVAGLRKSLDPLMAACLARTGKQRFVDKSLGAAAYAGLLRQVWPQAKYISLHRHPMDLIGSGIEASPWGLDGYGFENYVARFPGNSVTAIAQYWLDYTRAIVAAEQQFGPDCLRVRYEDLVTDPETEAKRVFEFLGVEAVPGITETMFSQLGQPTGRGDHKIWNTSRIGSDSVGRGWSVPAWRIPPPLLAAINGLAGNLGYLPVTPEWGRGDQPDDIRAHQ
ncbi:MAG TPA: sulfotransferase [Trebonia sp.]